MDDTDLGKWAVALFSMTFGFVLGAMCAEEAIEAIRQVGEVAKWAT